MASEDLPGLRIALQYLQDQHVPMDHRLRLIPTQTLNSLQVYEALAQLPESAFRGMIRVSCDSMSTAGGSSIHKRAGQVLTPT